ncbi:IclR family transcriptional regulator [Natronomonas salsuginis]|uniref:IclR family transcriptional regulator n=1 Tax=Natronomonas salsuginis TaxID=2217661 RepID=A0A4U5JA51_9EURY|nr:IclR family transcriptional regulator [Natronomonas salsuginis]TKR25056.1 IclR family transcriptional regulator [Natronomonas salsuginis]
MASKSNLVQSDIRLLKIVNGLQDLNGAGVTELAEHVDMKKSTVYKHLKTLLEQEYVRVRNQKYHLGFKFLDHGKFVHDQSTLVSTARPYLQDLADSIDKVVVLTAKDYSTGVYLHSCNDKYDLGSETQTRPGYNRFELHTTASGKSILAQLENDEVRQIAKKQGLDAKQENTISDIDELLEELDEIRERGYAINRGERVEGIWAIGSDLYSPGEDIHAAISIGGPKSRFASDELHQEYANELRATIEKIQLRLQINA